MHAQLLLSDANLVGYLTQAGLIAPDESASVEIPGEGNINWVRRVRCGERSWVVKQARRALEKFPEYEASTERLRFEHRYYETVAPLDAAQLCPAIARFDADHSILVMEDLGDVERREVERLDAALERGADVTAAAAALGAFLGAVHSGTSDAALAARFPNTEMQRLHGDHIFLLPYRPNEFPLSPALAAEAHRIQRDAALVATIDAAYARYLEPRGALIHADVQPTNILLTPGDPSRPRLLDAEIAHIGDPAFDIGILLAHLALTALAQGDAARARRNAESAWSGYAAHHTGAEPPTFADTCRYAGIELLRRTLGAARVACVIDDDAAASAVLAAGERWVRAPAASVAELG